jgi:hypothetical protein
VPDWEYFTGLEMNMNLHPKETFHYDDLSAVECDEILDEIKLYNEL